MSKGMYIPLDDPANSLSTSEIIALKRGLGKGSSSSFTSTKNVGDAVFEILFGEGVDKTTGKAPEGSLLYTVQQMINESIEADVPQAAQMQSFAEMQILRSSAAYESASSSIETILGEMA